MLAVLTTTLLIAGGAIIATVAVFLGAEIGFGYLFKQEEPQTDADRERTPIEIRLPSRAAERSRPSECNSSITRSGKLKHFETRYYPVIHTGCSSRTRQERLRNR